MLCAVVMGMRSEGVDGRQRTSETQWKFRNGEDECGTWRVFMRIRRAEVEGLGDLSPGCDASAV